MKNLYILGIVGCLFMSSCQDFLEKEPSTALPVEEAITSMTDLKYAVNGIPYLLSQDRMTYSADFAIYADLRGEDFYAISNNNQAGILARYSINKYSAEAYYAYYYFYKAIANVNKILNVIDEVPYTENEKATFDDYKGQLYAWRALLHFDLARYFCRIPTTGVDINAANSGLVLSTEAYDNNYIGERATLKETYEQIFKDFNTALPLLSKEKHNGYINYWAALALRSRVYLYNGQYNEALNDAKEVIACDKYKLYTIDNYEEAWGKEFTDESLFEMKITSVYNAQRNAVGYYCDANGYGECAFVKTAWLYQYLTNNTDDVRSKMIKVQEDAEEYGEPGTYPAKYPGRENSLYINNPKIIRLSEVYLIAAEAALYAENPEKDTDFYMNELRKNRISNYTNGSDFTIDDVLKERRVELFTENSMSFDYWRNKKSVKSFHVGESINYDDYRTVLPIPQDEIDLSGGILVQNPNY